jgi:hypothetical protein
MKANNPAARSRISEAPLQAHAAFDRRQRVSTNARRFDRLTAHFDKRHRAIMI